MGISDIPVPRKTALDATYAAAGSGGRGFTAGSGDLAPQGYNLIPNGQYIPTNQTITAALVALIYPSFGGTTVWAVIAYHANGTKTTITTVTIAAGARAAQNTGLSYAAVAGDWILVQNTAANGTSYKGLGPSVLVSFGGSITIPTAPAAVTSFTATPGSNFVDLSWTGASAASDYIITSNGTPIATTGLTTYRDLGPLGTGLGTGATNVYDVYSAAPLVMGPASGTPRTSGPASVYTYYGANAAGALDTTFWTTFLGSNSGTLSAVDGAGKWVGTSGNVGSNAVQDRVAFVWKPPAGAVTYSALDWQWDFGCQTSNILMYHYWSGDAATSALTDPLNYAIRMETSAFGYKIFTRQASLNSGSSLLLTVNGSTQATTTSAAGSIAWPIGVTADTTHTYGVRGRLETQSGGTQVFNLYHGTIAALASGSATLINTITLTAAQVTALDTANGTRGSFSGIVFGQQSATSPVSQKYSMDTAVMTPLSAANH